jgi:predicted butyrate kinase (DUF1464 family)
MRVIGIDPGTVSFDVCGLEDGQVYLDTTLPSADFAANPQLLLDLLNSSPPLDLVIAPSGYGLPLVSIEDLATKSAFYSPWWMNASEDEIPVLGGMGKVIRLLKESGLPVIFMPAVIHLPTVPELAGE